MTDTAADKVAHQYLHRHGTPTRVAARFVEAGYVLGPGGLEETSSGITLQKGSMYALGASSSPQLVILTEANDSKVKYLMYPFDGSAQTMEAWIAKDLLTKGTRTWLKTYGKYHPKLRSSMESLLKGGRGKVENLNDWKQITVQVVSAEPGKDEWRTAELYGNVGGLNSDEHGEIYEIETFQKELSEIKKDKRLKVLKVKNR